MILNYIIEVKNVYFSDSSIYNVEEYLDKCLESLLNQHYSDMEIVVVDDKSTDGSLNIAKKYEKYTNVK